MLCLEYFDREIRGLQLRFNQVMQQSIIHNRDLNTLLVLSICGLNLIAKKIKKNPENNDLVKKFVKGVIIVKRELNKIERQYKQKGGIKQKTETEMRKAA